MIYIFPHFEKEEKRISKIKGISRLFAFPKNPHFKNNGQKIILDSGAYGLSKAGRQMKWGHMQQLSEHYKQYANKKTICVAPDVYLNPYLSLKNLKIWLENGLYDGVSGVIQCEAERIIDKESILAQAIQYRKLLKSKTILFSNNAMCGREAYIQKLDAVFLEIKKMGFEWIHCLGAGWNINDIQCWKKLRNLDSLDSIAYYRNSRKEDFGGDDVVENIMNILNVMNESEVKI